MRRWIKDIAQVIIGVSLFFLAASVFDPLFEYHVSFAYFVLCCLTGLLGLRGGRAVGHWLLDRLKPY